MKLSGKLLLVELLFISMLMTGVAATIYFVALPSVEEIEYQDRVDDITRIKNKVDNEIDKLSKTAADWGIWDDTYDYAANRTRAYEVANLTETALEQLAVDMLMIVDQNREVLWHQHNQQSELPTMGDLMVGKQIAEDHPLLVQADLRKGGVYQLGDTAMLMAWSPILTSHGKGPAHGYLFFGKRLGGELINELSQQLRIDFSFEIAQASNPEAVEVSFLSSGEAQATGFIPFQDDKGTVLKVTLNHARPFYQQAIDAAESSLLAILVIGLLSCTVSYFVLSRIIVSPIRKLQRQAETFGRDSRDMHFQQLKSDDELGHLSLSFIRMAKSISRSQWVLEQERDDYQNASYTDVLTQLRNRRYLEDYVKKPETWDDVRDWVLLLIDLDHFKEVNDTRGHDAGDRVLQQLAVMLRRSCRAHDLIVRSGGEEFMVVCRNTSIETGKKIAERIRDEIERSFSTGSNPLGLTCSVGFFSLHVDQDTYLYHRWKEMIKVADLALYAAKNSGRNLWVGLHYATDSESSDGKYPGSVAELQHWIAEKRLQVYTSAETLEQIQWQDEEKQQAS